jgi:hypothetical protein
MSKHIGQSYGAIDSLLFFTAYKQSYGLFYIHKIFANILFFVIEEYNLLL